VLPECDAGFFVLSVDPSSWHDSDAAPRIGNGLTGLRVMRWAERP
jgi:hypothetical protein